MSFSTQLEMKCRYVSGTSDIQAYIAQQKNRRDDTAPRRHRCPLEVYEDAKKTREAGRHTAGDILICHYFDKFIVDAAREIIAPHAGRAYIAFGPQRGSRAPSPIDAASRDAHIFVMRRQ